MWNFWKVCLRIESEFVKRWAQMCRAADNQKRTQGVSSHGVKKTKQNKTNETELKTRMRKIIWLLSELGFFFFFQGRKDPAVRWERRNARLNVKIPTFPEVALLSVFRTEPLKLVYCLDRSLFQACSALMEPTLASVLMWVRLEGKCAPLSVSMQSTAGFSRVRRRARSGRVNLFNDWASYISLALIRIHAWWGRR